MRHSLGTINSDAVYEWIDHFLRLHFAPVHLSRFGDEAILSSSHEKKLAEACKLLAEEGGLIAKATKWIGTLGHNARYQNMELTRNEQRHDLIGAASFSFDASDPRVADGKIDDILFVRRFAVEHKNAVARSIIKCYFPQYPHSLDDPRSVVFPRESFQSKPLSPSAEYPVCFAVDTPGTHRRDDCMSAEWVGGRLRLTIHVADATQMFPIGSAQDRAFSAVVRPIYFVDPTMFDVFAPQPPILNDDLIFEDRIPKTIEIGIKSVYKAIQDDLLRHRADLFFNEESPRASISAVLLYDVVMPSPDNEKGGLVLNFDDSYFERRNDVVIDEQFNLSEGLYESAMARLKEVALRGGVATLLETDLHQALETVDGINDVSDRRKKGLIAAFLSTCVLSLKPRTSTSQLGNDETATAYAEQERPFPKAHASAVAEKFNKYLRPYTLTIGVSPPFGADLGDGAPIDEYSRFSYYYLLACKPLRPYMVTPKRQGRLFEMGKYSEKSAEEAMGVLRAGGRWQHGNLKATRPGRDYGGLYGQRMICVAMDVANGCTQLTSEKDFLGRIFDLENPADMDPNSGNELMLPLDRDSDEEDSDSENSTADGDQSESPYKAVALRCLRRQSHLTFANFELNKLYDRLVICTVLRRVEGAKVPILARIMGTCTASPGEGGQLFVQCDVWVKSSVWHLAHSETPIPFGYDESPANGRLEVSVRWTQSDRQCTACGRLFSRECFSETSGDDTPAYALPATGCGECWPLSPQSGHSIPVVLSYNNGAFEAVLFYPETGYARRDIERRRSRMLKARLKAAERAMAEIDVQ